MIVSQVPFYVHPLFCSTICDYSLFKDIKGIANSSALPSMVMVDKNKQPINKAYNLMDRRATEQVKWLKDKIGEQRIFDINCNRLDDHAMIVNLMWEKENRPKDFDRIDKVLTIDGFIRLRLTGKATANFSSGAFYGVVYNVRNNTIDVDLLHEIGIPLEILPDFYSCEEIVGVVTETAAKETGLAAGIPVAAGSVDCNAGWLGGGAIDVGDTQINLGSCGVIGVLHKNPDNLNDKMINCTYTTDSSNLFTMIAATTMGGQSLRYLRDNFAYIERSMENMVPGYSSYDYLTMQAESVAPGSEGLIVLPYLMGERTPIFDVNARGVIFGLSLNHTKAHLIRAFMEAVAYAMYDSFQIIKKCCSKINYPIVLNEGGAQSKLWRRIITDILNVPTVFLKSRTGAPFGDAILAGVAFGVFRDYSIAREKAEYIDFLEPDVSCHEMYSECFQIYKKIYTHLKEDFMNLNTIKKKYID